MLCYFRLHFDFYLLNFSYPCMFIFVGPCSVLVISTEGLMAICKIYLFFLILHHSLYTLFQCCRSYSSDIACQKLLKSSAEVKSGPVLDIFVHLTNSLNSGVALRLCNNPCFLTFITIIHIDCKASNLYLIIFCH